MVRSIPKRFVALTFIAAFSLLTSGNLFADRRGGGVVEDVLNGGKDVCVQAAERYAKESCGKISNTVKSSILACCEDNCEDDTCNVAVEQCLNEIAQQALAVASVIVDNDADTLTRLFELD